MKKEGVSVSTQVQSSEALDKKNLLLWLLVFGLPVAFMFVPLNLDPVLQKFFAITMWGVLSWMVGIIPVEATGLILPCLYIIFGVTSGEVAFAPWANTVIWVTATNVLLGVAADKSGVARRMAYSLLLKMDCNIKGLVWGFSIAGLLLSLIITDSFARAVIFITIAVGLCRSLEIPFQSKESTALGLAAFFGMSGPSIMTLTGGNGIQLISVYREVVPSGEYAMNYFTWLMHNLLPGLAWTLLGVFCILKFIKLGDGRCFNAREELVARKEEMGKMSVREWAVVIVMVFLVLDYIFAANFGLDPYLVAACCVPFFFLPKVGIMSADDFNIADFKILFMMTGAMAIGGTAGSLGIVGMMTNAVAPIIGGSSIKLVFGTFVVSAVANFILTPLAIIFSLSQAFAEMALALGINPLPVMYALNFGTDVYMFPYEFAILLLCYSFGLMEYKTTVKVLAARFVGAFVVMAVVCLPCWYFMGLL